MIHQSRTTWYQERRLKPLTTRQEDILKLLYLFRFLTSTQIQSLLGHKDKHRINDWLRDLMAKEYIEGVYEQTIWHINQPAVYNLSLAGIKFMKYQAGTDSLILDRIARDNNRSEEFIDKCITRADIAVRLTQATTEGRTYDYATPSDYADPDSSVHFLREHDIEPDLVIDVEHAGYAITFILQIFTTSLPEYRILSLIRRYISFAREGVWQEVTGQDSLFALFICNSGGQYSNAMLYTKKLLSGELQSHDIRFDFTTRHGTALPDIVGRLRKFEP